MVQAMVKMDWKDMGTACDPDVPDDERPGPDIAQLFTCDALHDICELAPARTRAGFAEIATLGESTSTEANEGGELPPAPVQTTW